MSTSESKVGTQISSVFKLMRKHIGRVLHEHGLGLSMPQFFILNIVKHEENATQQFISHMTNVDKSLVFRYVSELEEMQLLTRLPDDQDRRKKNLVLTPKGDAFLQHLVALEVESYDKLLAGVSPEEVQALSRALSRIELNLRQGLTDSSTA